MFYLRALWFLKKASRIRIRQGTLEIAIGEIIWSIWGCYQTICSSPTHECLMKFWSLTIYNYTIHRSDITPHHDLITELDLDGHFKEPYEMSIALGARPLVNRLKAACAYMYRHIIYNIRRYILYIYIFLIICNIVDYDIKQPINQTKWTTFYRITRGFLGAFSLGAACQQVTRTPHDNCPTWDFHLSYMLRLAK